MEIDSKPELVTKNIEKYRIHVEFVACNDVMTARFDKTHLSHPLNPLVFTLRPAVSESLHIWYLERFKGCVFRSQMQKMCMAYTSQLSRI